MPKKDESVIGSRYKSTISFVTARSGKATVLNGGLTPVDFGCASGVREDCHLGSDQNSGQQRLRSR
jgi:hypothetical protein